MTSSPNTLSFQPHRDRLLQASLRVSALLVLVVTLLCFVFVAAEAVPALRGESVPFTAAHWYPSEGQFGLGAMLVGSTLVTLGAGLLAVPTGIGVAIFVLFFAPRALSLLCRYMLLIGASLPSVVYGLWGLERLVPAVARVDGPGASLLAGVLTLALMVFPTVALFAHGVLASFPRSEAKAAAALALSPWNIAFHVAVPSRRRGLALAGLLGFGRAVGETMAVLMVTGNVPNMPRSIFAPLRTLTANIALEMGYAEGIHRSALFVGGLLLASAVLALALLQHALSKPTHA